MKVRNGGCVVAISWSVYLFSLLLLGRFERTEMSHVLFGNNHFSYSDIGFVDLYSVGCETVILSSSMYLIILLQCFMNLGWFPTTVLVLKTVLMVNYGSLMAWHGQDPAVLLNWCCWMQRLSLQMLNISLQLSGDPEHYWLWYQI